jgi:hypothetical protein
MTVVTVTVVIIPIVAMIPPVRLLDNSHAFNGRRLQRKRSAD